MASFIDVTGQRQEVNLTEKGLMYHYDMAVKNNVSMRQWLNSQYPTQAGQPDAFSQFCASAGLRFRKNEETGQPAANLKEVLNPDAANQTGGSTINFPQVPDSRLLFPAAIMEATNAELESKENEAMGAFAQLLAFTETIASDRFEQAIIALDGKKGPEDSAYRRVAQNAPAPLMLSLTAADKTRTVPTKAIAMTISHKVLQNNSLDMIARTLVHFQKKADYAEWLTWLGLILNGDPDGVNTPMATVTSALAQTKANTLDASIVSAGVLTQLAYIKWLHKNSLEMVPTHAVVNLTTAMAMDNRTGRPTVMHSSVNPNDRIDAPIEIIYPNLKSLKLLVMPDSASWAADTIMGLDASQAIGKVISSTANYEATQDLVLLRSLQMRFDRGILLYRIFDSAFSTLSLTL